MRDMGKVNSIRRRFLVGMRIRLLNMDDVQAPPSGTEGTVLGVDDIGSVLVEWDNGSGLSLVPELDEFEIIG